MLLHLGRDDTVFLRDVVMILDETTVRNSAETKQFVDHARATGIFSDYTKSRVRSYVLVKEKRKPARLIASPISAATLQKRSRLFQMIEDERGTL